MKEHYLHRKDVIAKQFRIMTNVICCIVFVIAVFALVITRNNQPLTGVAATDSPACPPANRACWTADANTISVTLDAGWEVTDKSTTTYSLHTLPTTDASGASIDIAKGDILKNDSGQPIVIGGYSGMSWLDDSTNIAVNDAPYLRHWYTYVVPLTGSTIIHASVSLQAPATDEGQAQMTKMQAEITNMLTNASIQ